jgi:hypothetical protein
MLDERMLDDVDRAWHDRGTLPQEPFHARWQITFPTRCLLGPIAKTLRRMAPRTLTMRDVAGSDGRANARDRDDCREGNQAGEQNVAYEALALAGRDVLQVAHESTPSICGSAAP